MATKEELLKLLDARNVAKGTPKTVRQDEQGMLSGVDFHQPIDVAMIPEERKSVLPNEKGSSQVMLLDRMFSMIDENLKMGDLESAQKIMDMVTSGAKAQDDLFKKSIEGDVLEADLATAEIERLTGKSVPDSMPLTRAGVGKDDQPSAFDLALAKLKGDREDDKFQRREGRKDRVQDFTEKDRDRRFGLDEERLNLTKKQVMANIASKKAEMEFTLQNLQDAIEKKDDARRKEYLFKLKKNLENLVALKETTSDKKLLKEIEKDYKKAFIKWRRENNRFTKKMEEGR